VNKKTLIVGMGFGNAVYVPVYQQLGFEIVTVDSTKSANFSKIEDALQEHEHFDTVHICTPNYTHEVIARTVALNSSIVFVEKPGVENHAAWANLVKEFIETTRFVMVKNNQYRQEIERFKYLLAESTKVTLNWTNRNRIPNPGSWFTTKELAFGGVSRDLMPHMLSYFTVLTDYFSSSKQHVTADQNYTLDIIDSTDYGIVDPQGIYNVDDQCSFNFIDAEGVNWNMLASWKNNKLDDSSISFVLRSGEIVKFELGLCPQSAYETMIITALDNLHNDKFWKDQYEQDMWIHRQIGPI
jgi:predicted dehydrogenase